MVTSVAPNECRRENFVRCQNVHSQTEKETSHRGASNSAEDIRFKEVYE